MLFRTLKWSFFFTLVGLVVAFLYDGVTGLTVAAILIVLEVSLSFDNAVVNAKILNRMSEFWQRLFLTVGVIIAVFGMRLLFPLIVVGVTARLSPIRAWELALEKGDIETPGTYAFILADANPSIAAFGGMFLMMIFLDFFLDATKDVHWLAPIERTIAKAGEFDGVAVLVALVALASFAIVFDEHTEQVLVAGVIGVILYLIVHGLGEYFEDKAQAEVNDEGRATVGGGAVAVATGKAAFTLFLYLELLDASFSFDGVIGAFAITSDPIIIAIGLGVGALYVRSITIYLVHQGTLALYIYLEHGAHWAIGALSFLLMFTIRYEIPEVITGLVGVGFIVASFTWSIRHNRLHADAVQRVSA